MTKQEQVLVRGVAHELSFENGAYHILGYDRVKRMISLDAVKEYYSGKSGLSPTRVQELIDGMLKA